MEKYCTSLELSKALKEAGISQESQFYWQMYFGGAESEREKCKVRYGRGARPFETDEYNISAFLSDELMEMLPAIITVEKQKLIFRMGPREWVGYVLRESQNQVVLQQTGDNRSNALAKMLLYLKKEGII